jgi:4-hydroxythreonine-4-phosphate dehydrogenase
LYGQRLAAAHAPKMLQDAGLTSAVIDLAAVRAPARELAKTMAGLACHYHALICDAETETDLRAVAMAIAMLPDSGWAGSIVWAGSSGLARHIPNVMGIAGVSTAVEDPPFRGPILLVVGSRSPLAHEQACAAGISDGMITVLLAPETLRQGREFALGKALDSGCDVMAVIDTGYEIPEDPRLSAALASSVSPHIDKVGALIATGGETARAVLIKSGITGLRLLREVEPGVPLAVSAGAREIPVITKSGSFGADGTLAHCVQVLRGLRLE